MQAGRVVDQQAWRAAASGRKRYISAINSRHRLSLWWAEPRCARRYVFSAMMLIGTQTAQSLSGTSGVEMKRGRTAAPLSFALIWTSD
jgi:hypothetical protein